ncbi:NADH dehydrogenase [Rhizoctonia solani AG-1 IA]|uniref:NADH dehydrogenase n=1 Tax=Thanatephorus cucumeris (strain AG1-IA) TaxID=983506 RepID=L8X9I7_THACA|nr:NADH dehydrogenase [Rhizoctonia solani AG-1 IA]
MGYRALVHQGPVSPLTSSWITLAEGCALRPSTGPVNMIPVRRTTATLVKAFVPMPRYYRPLTGFRRAPLFSNEFAYSSKFSTTIPRRADPSPIPGSPAPLPPSRSSIILRRSVTGLKWAGFLIGSSVLGIGLLTGALFIHDVFTYNDRHLEKVPVNPLALKPETGGPKNLPIASSLVGDEEDEEAKYLSTKPRLVIVGGGWGAVGVLQKLHPADYHVTIVSPETYTNFTPLLPSAAVGTVQVRSLIEPLRKLVARVHGHFVCGKAVDIAFSDQLLEVETQSGNGTRRMYIPYDKLIIAVGSVSAQHGVPGLENCFQLKNIRDAQAIRRPDNFEIAALPTTSPGERKRLLSFVICGGGPTGVETAAEIYDLCQEDIMQYVYKVQTNVNSDHILNTYSESISQYAEFNRDNVNIITNARVKAVYPDRVEYEQREPNGKAIEVDAHLRVKGAPLGTVYAVGDASTIETSIVGHLLELVDEADKNKDGRIDYDEWEIMATRIRKKFPMTDQHIAKLRELFDAYDKDHDGSLGLNELVVLLEELGNKITALPALSKLARQKRILAANDIDFDDDATYSDPFKYKHLGSLAYIGNAVFDLGGTSFMGGLAAMYAWRSVYWSEQVSMRTRALLMIDWIIRFVWLKRPFGDPSLTLTTRGVWGRDLSKPNLKAVQRCDILRLREKSTALQCFSSTVQHPLLQNLVGSASLL